MAALSGFLLLSTCSRCPLGPFMSSSVCESLVVHKIVLGWQHCQAFLTFHKFYPFEEGKEETSVSQREISTKELQYTLYIWAHGRTKQQRR